MQAQTHTIAFCSIETIAAIIQIHIASSLLAMEILGLLCRQNGSWLIWHWSMCQKKKTF
jgi:hypothetical protein